MLTASTDGAHPGSAGAGEEIVVPESVAAFLVRQRAVDIIDVLDPADAADDDAPE